MVLPTILAFVFAELPPQALEHVQELPTLPDIPADGTDNLPAVQFPEPANYTLSNVPGQANLPDFFDLL